MAAKTPKPFTLTARMQQLRRLKMQAETVEACKSIREGYLAWHAQAETLHKAGIRQTVCQNCCLWTYPHERCRMYETGTIEDIGD